MRRFPATALVVLLLAVAAAGCGEGGASAGAVVSVYVAAPLCKEARGELRRDDAEAGELRVQAICLAAVEVGGKRDLAVSGRNARRATEDTTAVAYLEAPGAAAKFGQSIVESADIAWIEASSGAASTRQVLKALEDSSSSSPRDTVREALGE